MVETVVGAAGETSTSLEGGAGTGGGPRGATAGAGEGVEALSVVPRLADLAGAAVAPLPRTPKRLVTAGAAGLANPSRPETLSGEGTLLSLHISRYIFFFDKMKNGMPN